MSLRFLAAYNETGEVSKRQAQPNQARCFVKFLDNTQASFDVDRKCYAQALLDAVYRYLDLLERDYFGLEFQEEPDCRRWLDTAKPLLKQLKHVLPPFSFHFGVRFYPPEPSDLQDECARYQLFLQVKHDLLTGRLPCRCEVAASLAGLALQAELGDYSQDRHRRNYAAEFRFVPHQTQEFEREAALLHRQNKGLSASGAELSFLHIAKQLDHYGCFLYPVTQHAEKASCLLGVGAGGLSLFFGRQRERQFSWAGVAKISFKRRQFLVSTRAGAGVAFSLTSCRLCKSLWRACVEHHAFFRLLPPPQQQARRRQSSLRRSVACDDDDDADNNGDGFAKARAAFCYATGPRNRGSSCWHAPAADAAAAQTEDAADEACAAAAAVAGAVTIRMRPDASGRFGFNVQGGLDQRQPISVSRVGDDTPAGRCRPRLGRGDRVLYINGRHVGGHTHEQAVQSIRAAAQSHSGELVLVVLPADAQPEPPPHPEGLAESVQLLRQALLDGALEQEFEHLPRRRLDLPAEAAEAPANVDRNRYRDVWPYDATRVRLLEPDADGSDYVNASHVVLEVAGERLRYVAAQGPLLHTCAHFWQMCWEQEASLLLMLTECCERGREKCEQYWPDLGCTAQFGPFSVTCTVESASGSVTERRLLVRKRGDLRTITQLQYRDWPDHSAPDNCDQFVQFVLRLRRMRQQQQQQQQAPVVVHCSAGVGRTGVLIAVDAAALLVDAGRPVAPLQLVRRMRDHRALLVQTSAQFRFVCDSVLHYYSLAQLQAGS